MKMIRIISTQDGFRRAGLSHPARAVDHPADSISAKQLAALKAEPRLVVQELDLPDAAPDAGNADKGDKDDKGEKSPKTGK